MLTQKKRKRTVEDFNQFCTFVLAYAGYIPYPSEEWWCNSNLPTDNDTCSPVETDATLSQKKGNGKEKAKKRKLEKKGATQGENKPKRKSDDSPSASKKSSKSKKSPKAASPSQLPLWSSVAPLPSSPPMPAAHGTTEGSALPPVAPQSFSAGASPAHFSMMYARSSSSGILPKDEKPECGTGPGAHPQTGHMDDRVVKMEPVEFSGVAGSSPADKDSTVSKPEPCLLGPESQQRSPVGGETSGETEEAARGEESDGWDGSEPCSGSTDILRLVMERRLQEGRLPEDQETGYHTDSTPDRGGSDTEQDGRSGPANTTTSSACDTEDTSMDTGKKEDDSWDLITCFCMKPFAGRPMIECNECGTWVHLSCAKIRRTHVPDIFVCQPCRDSKQNIRRSNRARTVPRKRFSD